MSKGFLIPPLPINTKKTPSKSPVRKFFLIDKLSSRPGFLFLFLVLSAIGVGIAKFGVPFGVLMIVLAIGLPFVYALMTYPQLGVLLFITLSYFIMFISKFGMPFPIGTVMDLMEVLIIIGVLVQQRRNKDWEIFKGPITTMILVWIGYNVLEFANPVTEVRAAWIYTVRTMAVIMLMYFVFVYNIRTKELVKTIFKLWLVLALFAALYAYKQQRVGFFAFEEAILNSDPTIKDLLYIGGIWRKFSIFTDPVVFAYTMAISALLCFGLMTGPVSRRQKIILLLLGLFYMRTMLFSGTRGAYVLIPVGLFLFFILKYNSKMLFWGIAGGLVFLGLIFFPTQNRTLDRFQSAFRPSNDASFNVRKINQKRIQPYILTHPMGGGLGSTGEWGKRFAPNSYLANFPPDSGYVRVAVELGPIGLLIFCIFMFTILKTGINNYYKIKDPELKSYCLAMVLVVFAINIGTYPQESIVQYPSNVNFYLSVALITVTMRLDKQQNELQNGIK